MFVLILQVHDKFDLLHETLFLTVNLIDRFLAKQTVARKKLQLVGLVAMLLACKYEEVSVPVVGDLILISDKAYTRKEVLEMVSFGLPHCVTPLTFAFVKLKLTEIHCKPPCRRSWWWTHCSSTCLCQQHTFLWKGS